jgi:hypothetical protein
MDRCVGDVITDCGLYVLAEEEKQKKKEIVGFIKCFEQEKRKEIFPLCLDV